MTASFIVVILIRGSLTLFQMRVVPADRLRIADDIGEVIERELGDGSAFWEWGDAMPFASMVK
jgi:hypothetical protein